MDEDGAETGVRCTLTSALSGQPDLAPADRQSWLDQLVTTQAAIHAVPDNPPTQWDGWPGAARPTLSPDRYGILHRPLDWLADSGLSEVARDAAEGPLVDEKVLVHGDYQHVNVLWSEVDSLASWTGRTQLQETGAATSATAGSTWQCCSTPRWRRTTW